MKKIIISLALILFSLNANAMDKETVEKFVDRIGNDIIDIAKEKNISEEKKREKIISVIDSVIDAEWIARFVLAKNYNNITEKQRERFTKLYRDFMINTYGPKFKKYNGKKFTVTDVTEQRSFYIAKAEFVPHDSNVVISVNFRVKERGSKLVILDFIAEGVSLIETQRSEFNSAISQNGIEKFLDDLELRIKNLKKLKA
jgi:phospholipid transport system substrate-binding protein